MIDWDQHVIGPALAVFGEGVMYYPRGGTAFGLGSGGVFDKAYTEVETVASDMPAMNSRQPVLGVRDSDFINPPKQRDQLVILRTGKRYIVKDVRPDGHGETKLLLNLVAPT